MPNLIELKTFSSGTGNLTVFENIIPGAIKRVFYIYGAGDTKRGGHRHHKAWNALICIHGSCRVYSNDGEEEEYFLLDNPEVCLILEPKDWHIMDSFSKDAILLVLSNEHYDQADYIDEPYLLNHLISQ
ncbi:sugar 3,4-ketoisomerase [Dyadobacter psychrotolerans]|uniref:WxcM-like domain-containing protein n=1 Tax=Dyadobacter psychrotolerans TaxID=2541721 RepID=A0A4R5DCQ2_9BACT|nr:FdtA/QdtA family cupin domain-containing protein [Dyadobacter psychrotolerans]TDE11542.1 WxcM-like domain-containing protein [Dyadobacter psychrotolerans]